MRSGIRRVAMVLTMFAMTPPAGARADWLFTPFAGGTFAANTTLNDPELGVEVSHLMFGVAAGWLSDGLFGVEGEIAYAPNFFERGQRAANLLVDSRVTTLTGSVIVAVPVSVTQYSLRPYVTSGIGMLHVGFEEISPLPVFPANETVPEFHVGGGAIGYIRPDVGLRFDLRYSRSLSRSEDEITRERHSKLAFWRASVGVVIRY